LHQETNLRKDRIYRRAPNIEIMKLPLFVFAIVLGLTGCQMETSPIHPETGSRKIFDVRAFGAAGD
jgi:hypothetical protein